MNRFFISTPIYYVNAKPHLGHAYSTIVADTMARFHRAMGEEAFFLTGTDEHGDKIAEAAVANKTTPQAYVDEISGLFKDLWPRLGIEYSRFIRTTDQDHVQCVQTVLQRVHDAGDIYFGEYGGHYCYGCERFYTEKELVDGLCPQHLKPPVYIEEKNYFFRMERHQAWLIDHIKRNPDFIRPERYRNEVLSLLESGALEDLCISRPKTRLEWGIELPFDNKYVCYVWFDALLNYVTALEWPDGEKFKQFWPVAQHLVAKDILKPHAVFWPTMLRAADMEPYQHLNVHGYWLVQDTKMSKSLGNVVEPLDMAGKYGLAAFRYFLLREMHFGNDASFSEEALIARLNADLANDLGNLFSRSLSMTAKYFGGQVPSPGPYNEDDQALMDLAKTSLENFQQLFGRVDFSRGLEALWELVRGLNKYIDTTQPWTLFKDQNMERLGTVMYVLLESMRKVAAHLTPVMPEAARSMLEQLGYDGPAAESLDLRHEAATWGGLQAGTSVAKASNLFPRVDPAKEEKPAKEPKKAAKEPKAQKKTEAPATNADNDGLIEFSDFQKLDLRVGKVLEAKKHPDADKLLLLSLDLGEGEPRQIVAGLAEAWAPEDLAGKQVAVVANLKPRKLRGELSHGMVMAVRTDKGLELLTPTGPVAPGSKIS